MKKILFVLLLGIMAITSYQCSNKTADEKVDVIDVDMSKVLDTLDMSSILSDSVSFVPLEFVDNEGLLGEISDIIYTPGFICVRDDFAKRFHIFDHSGSHISSISRQGRGNGEYVDLSSATIVGDSLVYIYDMMTLKLLVYDIYGNFKKKFDVSDIWCNELLSYNGELIAINDHSSSNLGYFSAFSVDPKTGVTKDCMAPFDENFDSNDLGWSLTRYSTQDENRVYYNLTPYDTIYTINTNGCEPSYFVNFNGSKIPFSVIKKGGEKSLRYSKKTGMISGVESLMVINDIMLLGFKYQKGYYTTIYDMRSGQSNTYENQKNKYLPGYLTNSRISSQNTLISWMDTQFLRLVFNEEFINSNKKYNESYFNKVTTYIDTVKNENYVLVIQNIIDNAK